MSAPSTVRMLKLTVFPSVKPRYVPVNVIPTILLVVTSVHVSTDVPLAAKVCGGRLSHTVEIV